MQDFNHEFAELSDILRKADIIQSWEGTSYQVQDGRVATLNARLGVRPDAHARPVGASFDTAEIEFELRIGEQGGLHDIRQCTAQIVVDGLTQDSQDLRFALHFDRHDPVQTSIELHAHYHWQVGGHRLDGINIAGFLALEAPRFPSHPLDPVLFVDFLLSHFNGRKRTELLNQPEFIRYRRLLFASQETYVLPFFDEISRALATRPFIGTNLWPSLCGE